MKTPAEASEQRTASARGHSSATLYEAVQGELRRRTHLADGEASCAVDPAIRAAWHGATVAGPAFTVQGVAGDNLALHRAVAAAPAGHVLVADLGGGGFGHWGEVLSVAALARNIIGLVIDGGVRDIDRMRSLDFPVFSRHNSVRGTAKLVAGELGGAIVLGGVPVKMGDLIVADADGVVVVPEGRITAVLDHADQRVADEQSIMAALRAGATTLDLYQLRAESRVDTTELTDD